MSSDAKAAAMNTKVLVLDCDGVLTDGGLYYGPDGQFGKRFNVQDGLGIKMAQSVGLEIAVITGLDSAAVAKRVEELGITEYHAGHLAKIPLLEGICDRLGVTMQQCAYLGDDWVDAGPLQAVGLPMAVANAMPEIKRLAAWVSTRKGGDGAVREAIQFILEERGDLDSLWQEWATR